MARVIRKVKATKKEVIEKGPSMMWKYLGAMMTEMKAGHMAASFTRVLGLTMFLLCNCMWLLEAGGYIENGPPSAMVTTLWGLIGIKGFKDGMKALKGKSAYEPKS